MKAAANNFNSLWPLVIPLGRAPRSIKAGTITQPHFIGKRQKEIAPLHDPGVELFTKTRD